MGFTAARYAVTTASFGALFWRTMLIMAEPRHIAPAVDRSVAPPEGPETRVLLTEADFDALVRELETLRGRHRGEVARRPREARAFGVSTDNDELLTVAEDAIVEQARIAQLEELARLASVVDGPMADDGAGLGSTVCVADDAGREAGYLLIGRRGGQSGRHEVTMASPVGMALWGARPGDVVDVRLPNGRSRTLRVLSVQHRPLSDAIATPDGAVRAA
jgi:transcription elongation factor GreA